jgi:hypothetical protein
MGRLYEEIAAYWLTSSEVFALPTIRMVSDSE